MTDDRQYRLGLSDLLEQDLSSYEFFSSLPPHLQAEIAEQDRASLPEIQEYVAKRGREKTE